MTGYKMKGGELKSYKFAQPSDFGKSSYFKAVMIASGGLSGGIGATIAGGSFWKGFRQGVITSGLNHVAHLGAIAIENEIVENKLSKYLGDNDISPYKPATEESLKKIVKLFGGDNPWIKIANNDNLDDWSKEYLKFSINDTIKLLELIINGQLLSGPDWGVTNPVTGKILLAPRLINGVMDNFKLAATVIHEMDHYFNYITGRLQGNSYIMQELNEYSAYYNQSKWRDIWICKEKNMLLI